MWREEFFLSGFDIYIFGSFGDFLFNHNSFLTFPPELKVMSIVLEILCWMLLLVRSKIFRVYFLYTSVLCISFFTRVVKASHN
jgi:hypothetical protein